MKKTAALISMLCITAALLPMSTQAAVTPHFIAVNDDLLPFTENNMPYISGSDVFVPHRVFQRLGIIVSGNAVEGLAQLFKGGAYVNFDASLGHTDNHDGQRLSWPAAKWQGSTIYVPLRQVCDFFGLEYELTDVHSAIIPDGQVRIVRIKQPGMWVYPSQIFMALNSAALKEAYDEYASRLPGAPAAPPAVMEPTPDYSDVTLYLNFHNIRAGGLPGVLDAFGRPEAHGYRAAFFLSAGEIARNASLVRRIAGNGHAIGIWLEDGTHDEYLSASALLFEAAKTRTVLVSADAAAEAAMETAGTHSLIFWAASERFEAQPDEGGEPAVLPADGGEPAAMFPTDAGGRHSIWFDCSGGMALLMPGVLAFLEVSGYTVMSISEAIPPVPEPGPE